MVALDNGRRDRTVLDCRSAGAHSTAEGDGHAHEWLAEAWKPWQWTEISRRADIDTTKCPQGPQNITPIHLPSPPPSGQGGQTTNPGTNPGTNPETNPGSNPQGTTTTAVVGDVGDGSITQVTITNGEITTITISPGLTPAKPANQPAQNATPGGNRGPGNGGTNPSSVGT